jgi:hypothetical protein
MTPFEYLEVAHNNWSLTMTMLQFEVSAWFGYLVATLSVGPRLTRFQVSILNFLFIVFCTWFIMGGRTSALTAFEYANIGRAALGMGEISSTRFGSIILPFQIMAMAVCMSFMWSVRHPEAEEPL